MCKPSNLPQTTAPACAHLTFVPPAPVNRIGLFTGYSVSGISFGLMLQVINKPIQLLTQSWPQDDRKMNGFFYGAVPVSAPFLCRQGSSPSYVLTCKYGCSIRFFTVVLD